MMAASCCVLTIVDDTDDSSSDKSLAPSGVKDVSKLTARQQTVLELLQTESNYVSIINTILKVSMCWPSSVLSSTMAVVIVYVFVCYVLHITC